MLVRVHDEAVEVNRRSFCLLPATAPDRSVHGEILGAPAVHGFRGVNSGLTGGLDGLLQPARTPAAWKGSWAGNPQHSVSRERVFRPGFFRPGFMLDSGV